MNPFKTKSGEFVIAQKPNWPIYFAVALYVLRYLDPKLFVVSRVSVSIVMLYWAYLEIFQGVNLFRRTLGLGVGLYFTVNLISALL